MYYILRTVHYQVYALGALISLVVLQSFDAVEHCHLDLVLTLQWRHNEHDSVSNYRRLDC